MKNRPFPYWILVILLAGLLAACSPAAPEIGVTLVVPTSISGGGGTATSTLYFGMIHAFLTLSQG